MSGFSIKAKAEIEKIDIDKGKGDESKTVTKLRIHVDSVPTRILCGPMGIEDPEELERMFHKEQAIDAERNGRALGLKSVASSESYKERHSLKVGHLRPVRVEKISGIKFRPHGHGNSEVWFVATIKQMPKGCNDIIAENLHHEIPIELEHDADLGLKGGGRSEPQQTDLSAGATPITKGKRGPKPGGKAKPAKATKRATKKSAKKAA